MTDVVEGSGVSESVCEGQESVSLYFKSGSSDKVYHARIEAAGGGGFTVNFAYGRRGGTLSTGTKTKAPVDHNTARRLFEKLVADKQSKGYTVGVDGTPYRHSVNAGRVSGLLPQLLNVVSDADAGQLVDDPRWLMQEKFDGRRLILRKVGDAVEGVNKLGLVVGVADTIESAARLVPGDFVLDGEAVGDRFHVFDLLSRDGADLRARTYGERYGALRAVIEDDDTGAAHISVAESWIDSTDKAHQLDAIRARNAEGVVFKRLDAPYAQGRPSSGGTQLKLKFVATASAVVTAINQQRSVRVSLLDGTTWMDVGAVTVPANQGVPQLGEVVEVRYLYAAPGGALYQPVLLGVRTDVEPSECVIAQLKLKAS